MFYQSQFALKTIQAAVQLYPSKLSATQNKRNTYIGTGVFFRSQIYNTKITSDPAKFMEAIPAQFISALTGSLLLHISL